MLPICYSSDVFYVRFRPTCNSKTNFVSWGQQQRVLSLTKVMLSYFFAPSRPLTDTGLELNSIVLISTENGADYR